jgi:hypothetical protein
MWKMKLAKKTKEASRVREAKVVKKLLSLLPQNERPTFAYLCRN